MTSKKLIRVLIYMDQQCSECRKELKKEEVAWIVCKDKDEEAEGVISKQTSYYCILCGNKIIEQEKSPEKIAGEICFFSTCKNRIKKDYYRCRDSKRKFCSQKHFEEVYGLHCSCCGKEINEHIDYLEKTQSEKTLFQRSFWVAGFLAILITVIMIILIQKEEKRKFRSFS